MGFDSRGGDQKAFSQRLLEGIFGTAALIEISAATELPSVRQDIELLTADNLKLVGELAIPKNNQAKAVLLTLHPLPTHGGFMDSHILRKAANRLPELADIAVLRFNTRGTKSPRGQSEGSFGDGVAERMDLEAALAFLQQESIGPIWLLGWSFGSELAIKYGFDKQIAGAILLSPPLRRAGEQDLLHWRGNQRKLIALLPEHDEFLPWEDARRRFAVVPEAELIEVAGAKHLWVGETATRRVLNEIVRLVNPTAYPLPTHH